MNVFGHYFSHSTPLNTNSKLQTFASLFSLRKQKNKTKMALKNMSSVQKLMANHGSTSPSFSHFHKSSSFKLSTPFLTNKIQLHGTCKASKITCCNSASSSNQATTRSLTTMGWNLQSKRSNHSDQRSTEVQELYLYEFNELDRGSPVYLRLSNKSFNAIGDSVSFTNKIYSGDLKKRLGTTAGSLIVVNVGNPKADTYEATFSFYFGEYGHISCQGRYKSDQDTWMAVTGGTGIFNGVYGQVKCHNLSYPLKLHYVFQLQGIPKLPEELTRAPVEPRPDAQPAPEAKLTEASLVN